MKVMGFAGAGVGLFPGIHHRRELYELGLLQYWCLLRAL